MSVDVERLNDALGDRYAIERELGRGGMATVYLATDLKHHRKVAVKVLDPDLAQTLGTERFLREIETAANLTHPHILPVFDSGEADGFLYYVMPFVEGETLQSRLEEEKQLRLEDALRITREIADALDYAHRQGVIHRDVKPANIMLEERHAVLADFGVARAVSEARDDRITSTGTSIGTPAYMSPEQGTGKHDLDGSTDQYALGCVLYEMLVGEPPFTGPTAQAVLARKTAEPVPSIRLVREAVPVGVEEAVMRALARTPVDRFATAAGFAEALRPDRPAPATPYSPAPGRGRRWRPAWVALVVLVLGVGGWAVFDRLSESTPTFERILVLPPEDLTGDTSLQAYLNRLLTQLIQRVNGIPGLEAPARATSWALAGKGMTVPEMATEARVDAVLETMADAAGDRISLTVSLILAHPQERRVWDGSFSEPLERTDELAGDVALAIAGFLQSNLTTEQERKITEAPEVATDVYGALVLGWHHLELRTVEGFQMAEAYFNRAVELDSTSAEASYGLAAAYSHQGSWFLRPSREAFSKSMEWAQRALDNDSLLAGAYAELGYSQERLGFDWNRAERSFRRAVQLDSMDAKLHKDLGLFLLHVGKTAEGLTEVRRGVELDPLSVPNNMWVGFSLYLDRQYEESVTQFGRTVELDSTSAGVRTFLALTLSELGRHEEAIDQIEKAAALGPFPFIPGLAALIYGRAGQRELAEQQLDQLMEAREHDYVAPDIIAWAQIGLGQYDDAVAWLRRAYEDQEQGMIYLKMASWYDALRDHPGFQELLEELAFPDV
jgi:serine/threonine-protein kinase